jgi:hypothetical protein
MNIFENALKITCVLILFFIYSCEKDENDTNSNSITKQIVALETTYKEGDVKIEFPWYPGFQKNESVHDASLNLKVRNELAKSYSKQTTYLKSGYNNVGVIKDGSCGPYQELYIFMDCEDSGAMSSQSGYHGDSWVNVNSSRNAYLYFCVVSWAFFQATNVDYAVLDLQSGNWPNGVSKIRNIMDTENRRNINQIFQGGTRQSDGTNVGGTNMLNSWYGSTGVTNSLVELGYYYYPKVSNSTPFPNLGISYGVFGSFGANQGSIFVDNEDGGYSWIGKQEWLGSNLGPECYPNSVSGIVSVDGNSNTTMYFSKVN